MITILYCMSLIIVGFVAVAMAHSVIIDNEIQKYEIDN